MLVLVGSERELEERRSGLGVSDRRTRSMLYVAEQTKGSETAAQLGRATVTAVEDIPALRGTSMA